MQLYFKFVNILCITLRLLIVFFLQVFNYILVIVIWLSFKGPGAKLL